MRRLPEPRQWLIAILVLLSGTHLLAGQEAPSYVPLLRAAEVGFCGSPCDTNYVSPAECSCVCADDARWHGFYVGGQMGYAWSRAKTGITPLPSANQFIDLAPTTLRNDSAGVMGGVNLGYNWQHGNLVLGLETDFLWTGLGGASTVSPIIANDGTPFPGPGFLTSRQTTDWLGSFRPRIGVVVFDRLLIYGTGGLAYGHVNYAANADFRPGGTEQYPAAHSATRVGWTLGAGVEIALSSRWSWKSEYLYYDLGNESTTIDANPALAPFQVHYHWETRVHAINTGLRFRF